MGTVDDDTAMVMARVNNIRPMLAGLRPEVQGAVLCDLLAMWLAGHIDPSSARRTKKFRERLLRIHVTKVRELISVNEQILMARWGIDA
jgi:hypothetical protein